MTQGLYIDIETFSAAGIKKGIYRYAEDPRFQILMAAWSRDGGPVQVAIGEDEVRAIPGLWDPKVQKIAHNAGFERICLSVLQDQYRFLPPEHWHDTMAVAGEKGYPQSLKELALALGGEQKDEAGTRLINLFCKPDKNGRRATAKDFPEEWAEFVEYCRQDVATLISVHELLGDFPTATERQVWQVDQHINDRGIAMDREMAEAAIPISDDHRMDAELTISRLTGVTNPGSQPQMLKWLRDSGLPIEDLRADTVEALLDGSLTPVQRHVLELRQELALVAAKKYSSALESVSDDGRLRGSFRFFGAHTGRWSGQGVQLHNLPRASLESEADTNAAILDLKMGLGAEPYTLKALVRAMFVGPFTVVDYSAIEARVIAWLAGERWALDAFKAGRDIYVETAERMGGLTRFQGKVAVLALGYNGGVGSLRAMGAEGSDEELQRLVTQWRRANPSIVSLWNQMEEAFYAGGPVGPHIMVDVVGDSRLVRLPSGRSIAYRGCKWGIVQKPWGPTRVATFKDPKKYGYRSETYGGRIIENVTQAVARDILAEALVRLRDAGYAIVGHVHDEVLVEGVGTSSVQVVSKIMNEVPAWATGLPIGSEGFTCARYRKG